MKKVILIDENVLEDEEPRAPFEVPIGETIIGREPFLQAMQTKVSRSHAKLTVTDEGKIKITSIHNKPTFYQRSDEDSKNKMNQGDSIDLNNKDKFYLVEEGPGYEVIIVDEDDTSLTKNTIVETETESTITSPIKRKFPSWMNDGEEDVKHKRKTEETSTTSTVIEPELIKDDENVFTDTIAISDTVHDLSADEHENDNEIEPTTSQTDMTTVTNNLVVTRRPCKYADKCYRKNPDHFTEFSHPNDPDYITATATTKPICPYGTNCYRKNAQHIQDFDHSKPAQTTPKKQKRTRKKDTKKDQAADWDSGSDDSYESSFIDDSSDEYKPSDESSDEEWDNANNDDK